jgi:uncharacterized membrane protein YcaP (DUF421 family)
MLQELLMQAAKATAYYAALIVLMRLAGKRLAGQTATLDLIVLITLAVVLQTTALQKGPWNALVFVVTVFALHCGLAELSLRSMRVRNLLRGKPRALIRDGRIIERALAQESISHADLMAGLRKLGYDDPAQVKLATLEETGHISAVAK